MITRLLLFVFLLLPMVSYAQEAFTITGTVTDGTEEPLPGVSVLVKGTSTGTATDIDGNFSIRASKGDVLTFSYIGFTPAETKVQSGAPINVVLKENSQMLDEVVVTALGIQRKESSLTYATQEIKGDDLMKVQDANFVNALNGKVSGVTITQGAGGAGGTSKILLRGNKSVMGNNSPLIVVDGIPMTNQVGNAASTWTSDAQALTYQGTSEGGDMLSLINPDDIESINVLKGANAAALYGSAAANGVLMITTKKGKEGKVSVTVNSNVTFEKPLTTPEIQRVYGAPVNVAVAGAEMMLTNAWGKKIGEYTDAELAYPYAKLRNYAKDDVSEFFRTGTTWNNSVSVSGGTEKVRSFFSYANANSNGMIPTNSYNRNTVSFRQNYSLFDNKLKIDVSLNYVYAKTKNRAGGGTVKNPLFDLYRMPGNIDMDYYRDNYAADGTWQTRPGRTIIDKNGKEVPASQTLTGPKQQWAYEAPGNNNPYWLTRQNRSKQTEERIYGSAVASYEIIPGLMVQGRFNIDRTKLTGESNQFATTMNPVDMIDYGLYGQDIYSSNDFYVDVMASYNKTFKDDYSVSASTGWVGHTVKGTTQKLWTDATYYAPLAMREELPTLVNFFDPRAKWGNSNGASYSTSSNWDKGWFFTGQLGWKDMVYLEGSYRLDWYRAFRQFSDRGTPDHYGYWSLGANTLVHRYVKLPEVITHLKLRASYSEVGNSIPNEVFSKGDINLTTGALGTSAYGYFENPRPEKSKSTEAGFDISLFNSNLNWDLTYYHTDLTNSYFLAATTGGKTKPVNTGLIRNQGIETTISYNMLMGRDWAWKTGFNVAYNDNKIVETYTDAMGLPAKMEQRIAGGAMVVRYEKGGSYGDIYARDFSRNDDGSIYIDPSTGTPVVGDNYIYLGNMNSKWNLGWSNTIRWKDLSLYFLISGRIGGKFISLTEAYLDQVGMSQRTADARLAAEASGLKWTNPAGTISKPGMIVQGTVVPIEDYYSTVGGQQVASEYVYNATNFRLNELSISYTLHNLFNGTIKGLTLSAVGRNLFFIYKDSPSDPDIALSTQNGLGAFDVFNMPSARSFGVNLKVEF